MVLQDIKGRRIQAFISKPLVRMWRGNIVEFNMYIMTNFIVVDKKEKTRTTTNRWSINFSHRTIVVLVSRPSFSLEALLFKPFLELLATDKLSDAILIDVIGEVVGKEDTRELITRKGRGTKRLAVMIEDLERLLRKPSNSARISQVFSHGSQFGVDELKMGDLVVNTIEKVLNLTQ
ncbi:hypothetical protein S245_048239, partial [Arachis hypogaea]